jgi:predicted LPLAT superfamily acyltransferase
MMAAWQQRGEIGNDFWLRFIVRVSTSCGRSVARVLMWPATLYFFLRRGPERRASRLYLERVLGRRVSMWHVYWHLHTFSCTILDRLFLFSERFKRFDIRAHGLRDLDHALSGGKGILLVGSHLGSFDALRVLSLERPEVMVRIVIDVEQNQKLSQFLNALNPALAASIINARQGGPAAAIAIKQALDSNAIVALLADRGQPNNTMGFANFLGHPAPFPHSPWLLASAVKSPVMLAFGLYGGSNRYDLYFEKFAESLTIERSRRAEALAEILQRFADRLAHYARLAPYNWFNFYDFWNNVPDPSSPAATDSPSGPGRAGSERPSADAADLVRRS